MSAEYLNMEILLDSFGSRGLNLFCEMHGFIIKMPLLGNLGNDKQPGLMEKRGLCRTGPHSQSQNPRPL